MATPDDSELGVSRSGRVRKKSSRLLEIEDESVDDFEAAQTETPKSSKSRRKSKSEAAPPVPTSPTPAPQTVKTPPPAAIPEPPLSLSKKSRKRKLDSDSQPSETSEVEDAGIPSSKKTKKSTKHEEHEDLKLKLHLGASPHVEKVTSPKVENTPKSASKRNKKSLSQTPEPEYTPGDGGLKLKLLLSPNKNQPETEETVPEPVPEPKSTKKRSAKKKGKKGSYVGSEETAGAGEGPLSPVEMSYEQFVEAIEEENLQKAAAKKKKEKPEAATPKAKKEKSAEPPSSSKAKKTPKEPKSKKSKKAKQLEEADEQMAVAEGFEDSMLDCVEGDEEESMHVSIGTGDFDPNTSHDDSCQSVTDASKAAANFFQNKAGKVKKQKVKGVKGDKVVKEKRQRARQPTAYTLWCNSYRAKVVSQNPGIDFAQTSKRLGEIWHALPEKEKKSWRKLAKKPMQTKTPTSKGSNLLTTGKKNTGTKLLSTKNKAPSATPKIAKPGVTSPAHETVSTVVDTSPLNAAAHLKLLGESLSLIGSRLTEHRGHIAVQGSLSVLLDSMLCALGPLATLCEQVPQLKTERMTEINSQTLDRLAYIMPGL